MYSTSLMDKFHLKYFFLKEKILLCYIISVPRGKGVVYSNMPTYHFVFHYCWPRYKFLRITYDNITFIWPHECGYEYKLVLINTKSKFNSWMRIIVKSIQKSSEEDFKMCIQHLAFRVEIDCTNFATIRKWPISKLLLEKNEKF